MYKSSQPITYNETFDVKKVNPQDYFNMYKQKMNALQNVKISHEKDPKFFRYLKRLVEAP